MTQRKEVYFLTFLLLSAALSFGSNVGTFSESITRKSATVQLVLTLMSDDSGLLSDL